MSAPVIFEWDGEAMVPLPRFARKCDELFVIGERYTLEAQRSERSHRHQFAWLRNAWANLPEKYHLEPWAQSPDHLRKYALIRTGWCNTETYSCESKAEAQRWAVRLRPKDEYSIVIARGTEVMVYTAKSQARGAMKNDDFQASKTAILDYIAGLLEVEPSELEKAEAA